MQTKTAIVTGYSSGLGYSFAELLLSMEWNVVGVSRKSRADELMAKYPGKLHVIHGSVAEQDVAERSFAKALDLGSVKMVVNCAGQGVFGPVGAYSADDIRAAMEANLNGLILFTDMGVANMRSSGGDIVNIMSTAAKKLRTAESVYTAAKWGAKAYTRTIRDAVKSEKLPIRVFEVYPCGMHTAFWNEAIRPLTDGVSFPSSRPIAEAVLEGVFRESSVYQQEFTFERS